METANSSKNFKYRVCERLFIESLKAASNEQNFNGLIKQLESVVPDLTNQYSSVKMDTEFLKRKIRNMHAFQVSLVGLIIDKIKDPTIVDIGDSSGTHLQYIKKLFLQGKNIRCLSVNLDKEAVEKIKSKGMEAVHDRAENLFQYDIHADVFLSFEMLEHLMNPCAFLHNLSEKTNAKYLVVTVPYLKASQVGLYFMRHDKKEKVGAEEVHIFELSPEDWKLLFRFSGWKVFHEQIYYQYPKNHLLYFTKNLWRKHDFEGFYGVILTRDNSISSQYVDWE